MHERNVVAVPEQRHDLLGLAEPQQAVVDEHAGELVADRLVDQHGRHGAIDAAGEPADHPALADLLRGCGRWPPRGTPSSTSRRRSRRCVRTKLRISAAPCGVWITSGWNISP